MIHTRPEIKYLERLSEQFPTANDAAREIINLSSILNLPKGTEHFITDVHGESEPFLHILKNGSGSIAKKIEEEFKSTLSRKEKKELATLIYYPEQKLSCLTATGEELDDWYVTTIYRLVRVNRRIASKYTRSRVRKMLPKDYAYVIEELLSEKEEVQDKEAYYNGIISAIIATKRAKHFVIAFCNVIQRLAVDRIHILGDLYDRGPGAHVILDTLADYPNVDFVWGNHDISWMGAASGSLACIASVVRISVKYGNFNTLESGYGINLLPLARFALDAYEGDSCACFAINGSQGYDPYDGDMDRKIHKAITVILFKLEGQLISRHPEYGMQGRLLLDKIDKARGTVTIDGTVYPLRDSHFPTIDENDPYALSAGEALVMEKLRACFLGSEKLQRHAHDLFMRGGMYRTFNGNLLYHGCVPLCEDGSFKKVHIGGGDYCGKALFDRLDALVRKGYFSPDGNEREEGQDAMWFLWANVNSPLYGKEKMTTFERYFVDDSACCAEEKNAYYRYLDDEKTVNAILKEFGLDPLSPMTHIINGHMPVHLKNGEKPVRCGGKLLMIDGGMSRPYQRETGIAGYTLVYNSYGMRLVAYDPFRSAEEAIKNESDIHSVTEVVQLSDRRLLIRDTDNGRRMAENIAELSALLDAYRAGTVREKR